MSDKILRQRLIRLAHANPGQIRDAILPVLASQNKNAVLLDWLKSQFTWNRVTTGLPKLRKIHKDLVSRERKLKKEMKKAQGLARRHVAPSLSNLNQSDRDRRKRKSEGSKLQSEKYQAENLHRWITNEIKSIEAVMKKK